MTDGVRTGGRGGRARAASLLLGVVAVAQVMAAAVLWPVVGFTWSEALDAFVVTNGLMGASFALSGLLIAWHRPRNVLGWLLLGSGLAHATSALMPLLATVVLDSGGSEVLVTTLVTVFMASWPWSIGLFLPLAVLVFPDGRLPGPRWRPVAWAIALSSPLFVAEMVTEPTPALEGMPTGRFATSADLGWLWTLAEVRTLAALLVAVAALVVRHRRAGESERRQLLWLLLAGVVVLAAVLPWAFVAGTPILVLLAIPLVPVAVTIAVIRHQLLDIRAVLSRAVAWLALSLVALLSYVGIVALLDTFVARTLGRSAFATVLVALALAPLLPRLQRVVDRWMYGDRRDPVRLAGRLGEHLTTGAELGMSGVVDSLRLALRLPYVALRDTTSEVAAVGTSPARTARLPLEYAGRSVGELEIGLRPGETQLAAADRATLTLVAPPLAVALGALGLSADLQATQNRLLATREEERRRLRRDLHDGLGPTLTGLAMSADAGVNVLDHDPEQARMLLASVQHDARSALADVRRLVDGLTPPVLGERGLLSALQQRAEQFRGRPDGTTLDVRLVSPHTLPALPEDVAVAAYRIASEALLNIARHALATTVVIEISCAERLDVLVTDDGAGHAPWSPGVGLESMRERATQLGGSFEAGPGERGGRVFASIPVVTP